MTIKYEFDPRYVEGVFEVSKNQISVSLVGFLDLRTAKTTLKVVDRYMNGDEWYITVHEGRLLGLRSFLIGSLRYCEYDQRVTANILDAKTIVVTIHEPKKQPEPITGKIQ